MRPGNWVGESVQEQKNPSVAALDGPLGPPLPPSPCYIRAWTGSSHKVGHGGLG